MTGLKFNDKDKINLGKWDLPYYQYKTQTIPCDETVIGIYGKIQNDSGYSWLVSLGFMTVKS